MTERPPDDVCMTVLELAERIKPALAGLDGPPEQRLTLAIMAASCAIEASGPALIVAASAAIEVFNDVELHRRERGLPEWDGTLQ